MKPADCRVETLTYNGNDYTFFYSDSGRMESFTVDGVASKIYYYGPYHIPQAIVGQDSTALYYLGGLLNYKAVYQGGNLAYSRSYSYNQHNQLTDSYWAHYDYPNTTTPNPSKITKDANGVPFVVNVEYDNHPNPLALALWFDPENWPNNVVKETSFIGGTNVITEYRHDYTVFGYASAQYTSGSDYKLLSATYTCK